MKFISTNASGKLKPLIVALGMTAVLVSGSSFAAQTGVTTNKSIKGSKPYIPYIHTKSSTGYLQVSSTLSFTGTGSTGYVLKKTWGPAEEAALAQVVAGNTAKIGDVYGINNADGSMVFVDVDGDEQTFKDRFNGDKVMVDWYKIPELVGMALSADEITADLANAGAAPPARWTYLGNTAEYTLKTKDINYQIAAVIVPISGTGDPDRNAALVIPDVLQFAGQVLDPADPEGSVKTDETLTLGPNPDIARPADGNTGVEPKPGADLRLVIHTDETYQLQYLAHIADPTQPLPAISSLTADEIFADSLDINAGSGNKLKTDTTYYAAVFTTDVEGSVDPDDYTVDVTNEYQGSLKWAYVDTNGTTEFEMDNDGKLAFRTLRDSNQASGKGDIDGSGTNPVNDGSVKDRVKDPAAITASLNLTSPTGKGLNEQGFNIRFSVDNGL